MKTLKEQIARVIARISGITRTKDAFGARIRQIWRVECWEHFHEDGERCRTTHNLCTKAHVSRLAWAVSFKNMVPTVMCDLYLDAVIVTGGYGSPAWYIGLVDNASFSAYAAGDTMGSHSGWLESTIFDETTRGAFVPGTISGGAVDNSASRVTYNINDTGQIRGAFIADDDTVGGTTGVLGGVGDFTEGTKNVNAGDTVHVQVTVSIASA